MTHPLFAAPLILDLSTPAMLALAPLQEGSPTGASSAPAGGAPTAAPGGNLFTSMIPILLVVGVFYFVLIGPERKQRKLREQMLQAIKKGDRVVTSGGLHGTIASIQDDLVMLQVDEGVRMKFNRAAIQSVLADESKPETKPASKH